MFHIRHTTTVSEYIERYTDLIEQLTAYNPNHDILAYTTRFIDGLHDDIRPAVLVARPPYLDSACILALLHEEASEQGQRKVFRKSDGLIFSKTATIKGALPLPPPPPRLHCRLPKMTRSQATSLPPWTISCPPCAPTARQGGCAFAVEKSGHPVTAVLQSLSFTHFKRFGIYARVTSMKRVRLRILQLLSLVSCACYCL